MLNHLTKDFSSSFKRICICPWAWNREHIIVLDGVIQWLSLPSPHLHKNNNKFIYEHEKQGLLCC